MNDQAWRGNGHAGAGSAPFGNGEAVLSGFTNTYAERPAERMHPMSHAAQRGKVKWDRNCLFTAMSTRDVFSFFLNALVAS